MADFLEMFGGTNGGGIGGLPGSRVGVAETFPRILASNRVAPTTANWNATATYLPAGLTITGITFFSANTALAAGTHQWFGIWDKSLTLVRGSADDTNTAWSAETAKRLTLTTVARTTYAGLYYVGLAVTAGTPPNLVGMSGGACASAIRGLTPAMHVLDTSTADTAIAPTLTQAATTTPGLNAIYAVLD